MKSELFELLEAMGAMEPQPAAPPSPPPPPSSRSDDPLQGLDDRDKTKLVLLQTALMTAVPFYAMDLATRPWAEIVEIARECAQVVASKGDVILFKSEKKGETAKAFNALAKGIACLSFAPGGVRTLGLHFENTHSGVR